MIHAFGLGDLAVFVGMTLLDHRHQGHLAVVVDQREACQHVGRQFRHRRGETEVAALGRQALGEGLQHLRVIRVDRADRVLATARSGQTCS